MSIQVYFRQYTYREYVVKYFTLCGILLALVIVFNFLINPFGVWDVPKFNRINCFLNVTKYERLYKMIQIARRTDTEALLVGASGVKKGMHPAAYEELTGLKTYNAGIDGGQMYDFRCIVEQAIIFEPELKHIILALNYFAFDDEFAQRGGAVYLPVEQVGHRIPVGKQLVGCLMSKDALRESMTVFLNNFLGVVSYSVIDDDGKTNAKPLASSYGRIRSLDDFAMEAKGQISMFTNFHLSKSAMDDYAEIVKLCANHSIELKVYINPVHGTFLECIYAADGGEMFEEWKRKLVEIHPVYDFAHFSVVGSEPFSNKRIYFRQCQHHMPITGEMVMHKVNGEALADNVEPFGVLLTVDNVNDYIEQNRRERTQWEKEHPVMVECALNIVKMCE